MCVYIYIHIEMRDRKIFTLKQTTKRPPNEHNNMDKNTVYTKLYMFQPYRGLLINRKQCVHASSL